MRETPQAGGDRNLLGLLIGFVIIAALLVGVGIPIFRQEDTSDWIRHTLQIETRLWRILSLVQDAETGSRGFLLTGDETYLSIKTRAETELPGELNALKQATSDNPRQQEAMSPLRSSIERRLTLVNSAIVARRRGDADRVVAVVRSGEDTLAMESVRSNIARMLAEEDGLLASRQARFEREGYNARIVGVAAVLCLFAYVLYAVTMARRQVRKVRSVNEKLTESNADLQQQFNLREKVESQLRQSQKMEAIGQLTGGVAHDFNNMLAVIVGSLNLLSRKIERGETHVSPYIESALDGARRAGVLSKQLLAFSRRQPLIPEPLDANRLVSELSELLRRTLGENVAFETVVAGGLWLIKADRGQLESTLLNLAVNARDAMPRGGTLTIETANAFLDEAYADQNAEVAAGQYVVIAITDTGVGMEPEVAARAFDPFFTTKPSGAGTGLGLSQVYGFVKQSLGHIKIYTEVGKGTSVKVYLPRYSGSVPTANNEPGAQRFLNAKPEESILVVEDDERVRQTLVESLRELGYTVVHAFDAAAAILKLEQDAVVTLLLTDIVMPGRTGKELADEVSARWPHIKVLYTTGYSRNAIVHNGVLDPGVQVLTKPYTLEQLAAKVREVLDGR